MPRSFYGRVGVINTFNEGVDLTIALFLDAARKAVLNAAEPIRERAHDLANVSEKEIGHARDGSHMRDCIDITIHETPTEISARIGIDMGNVPYAAHQEFGARGKPFIRPAIDEARLTAHADMAESMRRDIGAGLEVISTAVRFRRFA